MIPRHTSNFGVSGGLGLVDTTLPDILMLLGARAATTPMAQAIHYKRPRRINAVSITLLAIFLFVGYLISQYLPIYFRKQEAYRVLDETSSQFSGQKNRYLASDPHLLQLRQRMGNDLRLVGIDDPEMEHWIEVDDKNTVRFGVLYSETITWPFDVIAPKTEEVELEYTLNLTW